jgi:hypothetical protein
MDWEMQSADSRLINIAHQVNFTTMYPLASITLCITYYK